MLITSTRLPPFFLGGGGILQDIYMIYAVFLSVPLFFFSFFFCLLLRVTLSFQYLWHPKKITTVQYKLLLLYWQSYQYESVPYYKTLFLGKLSSDTDCPNLFGICSAWKRIDIIDINTPKQQFKKHMQIANIDVWTDPSQNFITFAMLKSHHICKYRVLRANCNASSSALTT